MPQKRKIPVKLRPPCPDPELYQWVEAKEGGHWRRRRGTVKDASLNRSFSANKSATSIVSPAASRIRKKLEEYTRKLATGRLNARLSGLLSRTYKEKGTVDFSALKGFEFQKEYPLDKLLLTQYRIYKGDKLIEIQIPVTPGVVKQNNKLVTNFYFEGVLLFGDALAEGGLKTAYVVSKPYSFIDTETGNCRLVLPLPDKKEPWMLILKLSCLEGNEMAAHVKHYGMRVVEVGG